MKQKNSESTHPALTSWYPESAERIYSFDYWFSRHNYYHRQVISFYSSLVPKESSVLHLQAKNGYVLEALNPRCGVGVETDPISLNVAKKRYPQYDFFTNLNQIPSQKFDYILLSFATMETDDIHTLLYDLKRFCHDKTRIVVESYRSIWAPLLSITGRLGLRRPTRLKNWVSYTDLHNFFALSGYESITRGGYLLFPWRIPGFSFFLNNFVIHLPFINRLALHQWIMIQPRAIDRAADPMVSVIIPCRNEKGNIEDAIARTPQMGKHTEFIFVEGHSNDGTYQEIERIIKKYPQHDIRLFIQEGRGKGDAVRKGFDEANGDILIILDADLTTPPEELPKFYEALVRADAQFINGSRLVYGMESGAMGFASWIANSLFGWLVSWIIGQRVSDTLCGTKVLWKKDYEAIAANRSGMGLWDPFGDFDLLFGAAKLNLKIVDVPIHYKRRIYGTTNIARLKEVWFLLWMCARAWWVLRVRA